jgi:hypothetical protein
MWQNYAHVRQIIPVADEATAAMQDRAVERPHFDSIHRETNTDHYSGLNISCIGFDKYQSGSGPFFSNRIIEILIVKMTKNTYFAE